MAEKMRSRICSGFSWSTPDALPALPGGSIPSVRRFVRARALEQVLEAALELSERGLGLVGVEDLELAAEDLAERPVGDARPVRGAPADADRRLLGHLRQPLR
jgi:hypothetical protein